MRDYSANALDRLVKSTLRTTISSHQKRAAWAALQQRALAEPGLEPVDPRWRRVAAGLWRVIQWILRLWHWLLLDETRYDRALRLRRYHPMEIVRGGKHDFFYACVY